MRFRITHKTHYIYSESVSLCHNEIRLSPRNLSRQNRVSSKITIEPPPNVYHERKDFFGNHVSYFAIQHPHEHLTVTALSEVTTEAECGHIDFSSDAPWESVQNQLFHENGAEILNARQFLLDSPMLLYTPESACYAQESFTRTRGLLDCVTDLMERIYRDFAFDPDFSTLATPLPDVFAHRKGVCQDFAHVAISCARAMGLPARYVSGYIESTPAPGKDRLVGVDASHAWFSVFIPNLGWMDFDPTNNMIPSDRHITIGWGRDYSDITPIKGVVFGAGKHELSVSVDVERVEKIVS
jgi:transglutaminase-like putative cysteine protease